MVTGEKRGLPAKEHSDTSAQMKWPITLGKLPANGSKCHMAVN